MRDGRSYRLGGEEKKKIDNDALKKRLTIVLDLRKNCNFVLGNLEKQLHVSFNVRRKRESWKASCPHCMFFSHFHPNLVEILRILSS